MALTDPQKADVRRWLGWPILNNNETDYVYGHSPRSISLTDKLDGLNTTDETILTETYLANLATMEQGFLDAQANMDTVKAGPWEANPREVSQRRSLFTSWRIEMAAFLGFPLGPGLSGGNSVPIVRC